MGLGRNLDRHFRVATLDATVSQDISSPVGTFTVATAFGGQKARGLNPSQIDFYLGGANRGSGYRTGIAATPSGAYGSARVYAPNYTFTVYDSPVGIRPYFGYNSAVGQPVIGHSLRASSVEVGTQVQISRNFSGEIGYALITDHQGAHADNGLVNFNVVASF